MQDTWLLDVNELVISAQLRQIATRHAKIGPEVELAETVIFDENVQSVADLK